MEAGLAVEEDLLDAEAVGLRGAEDLGVEWGLGREGADEGEDLFADFGLAGEGWALVLMAATTVRRSALSLAAMALR